MDSLTELDILEDVAKRLTDAGFSYMLTGLMAMNYYAEPRMTRDIDLVIALKVEDATRLIDTFSDTYYISDVAVTDAIQDLSMFNLIHLDSVVKVDIIVRKADEYRHNEFERRIQIEFAGIKLWIVSKEDLILSKIIWSKDTGSGLQSRDIKNLLATQPDEKYLHLWAEKLGVLTILENLKA